MVSDNKVDTIWAHPMDGSAVVWIQKTYSIAKRRETFLEPLEDGEGFFIGDLNGEGLLTYLGFPKPSSPKSG